MSTVFNLADAPSGVDDLAWIEACRAVRDYCGWHIAPSITEEVTVDGSGGALLLLPTLRLTDLASITNDGRLVANPEWSQTGMVRGSWTGKFRGVVANMTHGFDECPAEVVAVIREMVDGQARTGVSQVTTGSHQVSFDLAPDVRQRRVLNRYRLEPQP